MYIRIFSFIKNEIHLIEPWLKHHGPLVNWWGLHIIDNGSTDGTTMILNRYKKKYGINVYHHDDFINKGRIITEKIKKYKNQPGVCFALDGDEFISLFQNNKVNKNILDIKNYIKTIYNTGDIYCTKGWLTCVPEQPEYTDPVKQINKFKWELTDRNMCKKFVKNNNFISYDLGHHQPKSTTMQYIDTDIAYLHYHGCSKSQRKVRCEELIVQHGMKLETIQQQIVDKGKIGFVKKHFAGRDRVQEYMNINNWKYEPTDNFDVEIPTV